MMLRLALLLVAACAAPPPPQHAATLPVEHVETRPRNAELTERARQSTSPVAFLGDSITQQWETAGRAVWESDLKPFDPIGLGVGGDRTEHLLWRLQTGDYDKLPVRVAVVLIGTNNLGTGQTPEMTADGVRAVLDDVLARWPDCRVLLLALLPRGARPDDPLRLAVGRTNELLREVAQRDRVTWLDFGGSYLASDGTLPAGMMPDALHLSEIGYRIWAAQMSEPLARLRED